MESHKHSHASDEHDDHARIMQRNAVRLFDPFEGILNDNPSDSHAGPDDGNDRTYEHRGAHPAPEKLPIHVELRLGSEFSKHRRKNSTVSIIIDLHGRIDSNQSA